MLYLLQWHCIPLVTVWCCRKEKLGFEWSSSANLATLYHHFLFQSCTWIEISRRLNKKDSWQFSPLLTSMWTHSLGCHFVCVCVCVCLPVWQPTSAVIEMLSNQLLNSQNKPVVTNGTWTCRKRCQFMLPMPNFPMPIFFAFFKSSLSNLQISLESRDHQNIYQLVRTPGLNQLPTASLMLILDHIKNGWSAGSDNSGKRMREVWREMFLTSRSSMAPRMYIAPANVVPR